MMMVRGEALSAEVFTGNDHHGVLWIDPTLLGKKAGQPIPVVRERNGRLVPIEAGDVIFRYEDGFSVGETA